MEYLPAGLWRSGRLPYGVGPFDYHLCVVSPPDEEGWCSFGGSVWMNPTFADNSKTIIAEVNERAIRTGGANRIHVDRIDRLVLGRRRAPHATAMERAQRTDEENRYRGGDLHARRGGACPRRRYGDGRGAISAALAPYLTERQGLGIHTELLPGGVVPLVRSGVVTGEHKSTHPGKVIATGIAITSQEELDFIDGNPAFELYDFTYTDDIELLVQERRLVAVNNAMQVDLTGQVNGEAIGPWPFTGRRQTASLSPPPTPPRAAA
jgi:acyl-CoA hydrolase